MRTVTADEAETDFYRLMEEVEHGEKVIITKEGKPIAKLTPLIQSSKITVLA
jgi:prevent-host-death family protein